MSQRSRNTHLERAARSAGEAFAWMPHEEATPAPRRHRSRAWIWLGLGTAAVVGWSWL